ncbi:MAG: FAD/NAD(P)-binding protein [Acidobacteriota bacterium]|nr:FAD/NAD(P)-binding protein [Acidobacteriota bacterium]
MADPMLPEPYRIARVRRETHDTFTLELLPINSARAMSFAPGQFNMLYVFGTGESAISISGATTDERLVHTIRAVGTVTRALQRLKRGDVIGVRGPFGTSWPMQEAIGRDVVIVTGGIGLAPLRPVIYQVLAQRAQYGKFVLLYGARTPRDLLYARELEKWRGQFDCGVEITLDTADNDWRGNVGFVTALIPSAQFNPTNTVAMICGPEVMMRFTAQELRKRGMRDEQIYLSLERNMKCAVGFCGHCQYGPHFICKDGPVFRYDRIASLPGKQEL